MIDWLNGIFRVMIDALSALRRLNVASSMTDDERKELEDDLKTY